MGILGKLAGNAVKKVAEQAGMFLLDDKLERDYKKNTGPVSEQCKWVVKQRSSRRTYDVFDENSEKVYIVKKARNDKSFEVYDLNENEVGKAWLDWNPFSKRKSYSIECGRRNGSLESKPAFTSFEYECDFNHWKISQNVTGSQITITKPKGDKILIQHAMASSSDGYAGYYVVNGADKRDMLLSVILAMTVRDLKNG